MINYLSIHYASPIIPLTDKRTLSYGTPIRDGYFSSNRNASRGWGAKCRVLTWLFPSSATGLLMSPRSRTRSVRIIVLTYQAFVARPESISNMFRWNLQSAACVPCVCLCLCVHPRFAWKKRNWQMRIKYEKRYERVIVFDSFAASNLRLIEVEDWFNWLQEGWLVFLEKKCDILYLYRESCFFLSLNVICLV